MKKQILKIDQVKHILYFVHTIGNLCAKNHSDSMRVKPVACQRVSLYTEALVLLLTLSTIFVI